MNLPQAAKGETAHDLVVPQPHEAERHFGAFVFSIPIVLVVLVASGLFLLRPMLSNMAAQSSIKSLRKAITHYQHAYRALPCAGAAAPVKDTMLETRSAAGNDLFSELTATSPKNYRGIVFWYPPSKGARGYTPGVGLSDSWGKDYRVIIDYDNDGRIADPEGVAGMIGTNMYSAGPDGDYTTWKDNVCSWR